MELYEEIVMKILSGQKDLVSVDAEKLKAVFESECYKALEQIRKILKDDTLDDAECFQKIEDIVCVFENLGSGCGTRHDFG